MENKYYKPERTEFRVGFEYEVSTAGHEFEKVVFTEEKLLYGMINAHEEYRVKYLDQDDIVAEGWVEHGYNTWRIGEENEDLVYFQLEKNLNGSYSMTKYELSGRDGERFDYSCPSYVIGLPIRNRSELKTIMRMVGLGN